MKKKIILCTTAFIMAAALCFTCKTVANQSVSSFSINLEALADGEVDAVNLCAWDPEWECGWIFPDEEIIVDNFVNIIHFP